MPLIELEKLTKRFGSGAGGILAVDRVSFKVEPGEVLGFLGPNGAGKSTTMKMITGFLAPTSGRSLVCSMDVQENPLGVKERIGYLPEGAPAYPDMTPESFLNFCAGVRRLGGEERRKAIRKAVERTQLDGVMRQPIDTLSKGFRRRVGLAQAILHEPDVLIMDEPTDGLDPNQKHEVRALIRQMASGGATGGRAIVLSTHILEEVEAVCTRAIVIAGGRVVADDTPHGLAGRSRMSNAVTLTLGSAAGAPEALRRLPGVASVEDVHAEDGRVRCTVFPKGGRAIAVEVGQLAQSKGWQVESLRVEPGRLDDVFRDLTTHAAGGGEGSR